MAPDTAAALAAELAPGRKHDTALALDFDGVCKLFTEHKHQIMRTLLFLHLREFQRVPFPEYLREYNHVNFRSELAGKERFRCADALARRLHAAGYDTALPALHAVIDGLLREGGKLSAGNLARFSRHDEVARALEWSDEVNERVAQLTEIGLTPGIAEHIFAPFRDNCDFYVVTTASAATLVPIMEKEGIDYIIRYLGQETATKTESLSALCRAGYRRVFMFGDSMEDARAAEEAAAAAPPEVLFSFIPVIPGDEEASFAAGHRAVQAARADNRTRAAAIAAERMELFRGREAGKDYA